MQKPQRTERSASEERSGKNGVLQKLELWLARGKGTFLVGDHATAPDFHLYELLDQLISIASFFKFDSPVKNFAGLAKFYSSFGALPAMQPYLKSAFHKLPHNQKMAKYGEIRMVRFGNRTRRMIGNLSVCTSFKHNT